ncbi:MAG: site-specific DNA-methyltransferase [Acidobacteria bacterium]|nr:site-specific DNA-methyltransferase [Acidobacteriota bacterium]
MPVKYISYIPETTDGQAILDNFTRTRRVLRYRENGKVIDRIKRGLPLYEVERTEKIGAEDSGNLLLRGECLSACAYLKDKNIKVDLVYIDPPFASGADYARKIYLRRNPKIAEQLAEIEAELAAALEAGEEVEIEEYKAFEEKMYGDIWHKEDYLNWMYENLYAIKSIMSDTASIYVHLDWHIGHYIKILMDEVFGENSFLNEIIWERTYGAGSSKAISNKYPQNTDTIFIYTKNEEFIFNKLYKPYSESALKRYDKIDEQGKRFKWANLKTYSKTRLAEMIEKGEAKFNKGARDPVYKYYLDEDKGTLVTNLWNDLAPIGTFSEERADYATQKPEVLLERIIKGLKENGAAFEMLDIKDGVSLFRNPIQTMDKLKSLIVGLRNEDQLDKFWEGAIEDSKEGLMPVYIPNLLDHSTKVLDIPLMNRILNEAMPDLAEDIKKVIIYYIDIEDRAALDKFISEKNETNFKIELRDLKEILDDVVLGDIAEYDLRPVENGFEIEFNSFVSDRLNQKIDEYNQKKALQGKKGKKDLFDEETEDGDEETPKKKTKFKPLEISDNGLELIEFVSLDCTNKEGVWKSEVELKIDKNSFVILNGKKTKEFWNGKIFTKKNPIRMKVRNIAGDESIIEF